MGLPRLVVAGTTSGVGKTTVAAGIIAAFGARGLQVQPFKCGPDYIDPSYHTLAAGLPCRNLDSWMLSRTAMLELFAHAARAADVAIIEGVMGLYNGRGGQDEAGSTAEIAKGLRAPVVLVVDADKTSRSAGAIVLGYQKFDPSLPLAGVVLNHIGSPNHLRWATEAIEHEAGVRVLGYLPKSADLTLPARHLGLVPAAEQEKLAASMEKIRRQVETTVDLEALLALARGAAPLPPVAAPRLFPAQEQPVRAHIAVAQDAAFSFYYQDNLDLLAAWGARLSFVSPLWNAGLPADIQGLYIGGGFPEMYARELAANSSFKRGVREAAEAGVPIYGECGGLMYLCEGIIDFEGQRHEMVGLVGGWAAMQRQRVRMGYAVAEVWQDSILARRGQHLRGHQFHWSELAPPPPDQAAYRILEPADGWEGFVVGPRGRVLGSYLHLHFGADPSLARRFIEACADWAGQRG